MEKDSTTPDEKCQSLRDHAELWWKEQDKVVPEYGTGAYSDMYGKWLDYAFKDLATRQPR